jgi:iron complex outermembrane receptor protein
MRFSSIALAIILFLVSAFASARGTVHGTVYDRQTGEPLAGVYVIFGFGAGTSTDEAGHYSFVADTGTVTVEFKYVGYAPVTEVIRLSEGEERLLDVYLVTESHSIDQIVVSASRTEQKISELTVSMDVIKSDYLSRNHITDAQELINKTPGIEVMDGQTSIRGGSGYSYGVGSRVLALIDGLPLMAADAGSIKWGFMPLENLSQVEIIKGASSVLYGSSALNGVINFRTADASNIPVTRFYAEAGIYGKPANRDWIWWNTPRLFENASFSHLRKEGNTDLGLGANLTLDNGYRKYNDEKLGRLSLRLKHSSARVTGLKYGLNLTGGVTDRTDFVLWENGYTGALKQDTSSVSKLRGYFFAADPFISLSRNGRARHDIRGRLQYSENRFPVRVQNDAGSLSLYSEYQFWYKISGLANVTAGLSENRILINSNFFGDHRGLNLAGFAQLEVQPVKRLKVSGGVRVEQNILDGEWDKLVPVFRTGVNFQAAEYTFLRASFGQGYRYPSVAEKYATTTLGSVRIFPNPSVEAESGWTSEAGIKQGIMLGEFRGEADLSVFFSQNKNMIEYIFGLHQDPATGTSGLGFKAINVEQSRVYGSEIEFLLSRSAGPVETTITGGYTFIYPVQFNAYTHRNTDIYLKYRRKHSAKLGIMTSYKNIEAGIDMYVRSKTLNIDDVFLDPATRESILPGFYDYWTHHNRAYFLMDGNIGYRLGRSLTVSLAVKNITNTEYMGRPGDIQPQRNYSLRLSGKF